MWTSSLLEHLSGSGAVWFPVLVDAAIKGVAVLALTGLATLAMRRASAAARHLVWFLGAYSLLILPILSAALPGWYILPRLLPDAAMPAQPPAAVAVAPAPDPFDEQTPEWEEEAVVQEAPAIVPTAPTSPVPLPAVPVPLRAELPWRSWVVLVWLSGNALFLGHVMLGYVSLWWLRRRSTRVHEGAWPILLQQVSVQLGLRGPVELLASPRRAMPMTWGLWRTRLLLPEEAAHWPVDPCRAVLLHELAHAKRWDCLTQLVVQIACALHWFNPLVWLAWRRMQTERERACDDLVLRTGAKASTYAEQLLHIASEMPTVRFSAAAIAMARPSKLEGRLLAILDAARNRKRLALPGMLLATLLITAIVVPVAVLRARTTDAVQPKPEKDDEAAGDLEQMTPAALLERLRAEDKAFCEDAELIVEQIGMRAVTVPGPIWRAPENKRLEISLLGESWAFRARQADEVPPPYTDQAGPMDYDRDGNLIVWRDALRGALCEPDFHGQIYRSVGWRVPKEGTAKTFSSSMPIVSLYPPFAWREDTVQLPLLCAGRDYSRYITEMTSVTPADDGLLKVTAKGIYSSSASGTWHLVVDPNARYMVRAAKYEVPDHVYLDLKSTGLRKVGSTFLPDSAPWPVLPAGATIKFIDWRPRHNPEVFDEMRRETRGPFSKGTNVFDMRWDTGVSYNRIVEADQEPIDGLKDAARAWYIQSLFSPESKPGIRERIAKALGVLKGDSAVEALIKALKDEAVAVRSEAARSLGRIGDPRAVDALIETYRDRNRESFKAALQALADIGGDQARRVLTDALQDQDADVRAIATKALGRPATQPSASQGAPPTSLPASTQPEPRAATTTTARGISDDPAFSELWKGGGADKTPLVLDMGGLSRQAVRERLLANVRHDAAEQWPDAQVEESDGVVRVLHHVREQDVERPASKAGGTERRRELGPEPGGFLLEVWLTDQVGQALRPQTLQRDPWRTFLGELHLSRPDLYLEINVSYGRSVDGRRLDRFVAPGRWLAVKGPPAAVPARPPSPSGDRQGWSHPVNGLSARIVLARDHVVNGTPIISTHLELRNVTDPPAALHLSAARKLAFRVVDSAGRPLPGGMGHYDGFARESKDLLLRPHSQVSDDLTCTGLGIPGDQAALIDLGVEYNWVIAHNGTEYSLHVVLEVPKGVVAEEPAARAWHGQLEVPPARVPLKPQPLDPATAAARIEELGRAMIDSPGEAGERAARALSLIDDPGVIPWYAKAVQTNRAGLKHAALDRLSRFNTDEALAGLKVGMTTRGADIANCATPQVAEQSADNVRHAAAVALARSPHPQARGLLMTMWKDGYKGVRNTVVQAASRSKDQASLDLLTKMTADADSDVRTEAARVLRAAGQDPGTRPAGSPAVREDVAVRLPGVDTPTAAGQPLDLATELRAAFHDKSKEWQEGYVESLVAEIELLVSNSEGGVTEAKIRDLARGIRGPGGVEEVLESYHPMHRELCRQRVLHLVRSYLEHGPGRESERRAFQEQIANLVKGWQTQLISEFPQWEEEIRQAAAQCLDTYRRTSENPLCRGYKKPVSEEALDTAQKVWEGERARLSVPTSADRTGPVAAMVFKFHGAMGPPLSLLGHLSLAPSAAESPDLKAAIRNFTENRSSILEWEFVKAGELEDRRWRREIEERRRQEAAFNRGEVPTGTGPRVAAEAEEVRALVAAKLAARSTQPATLPATQGPKADFDSLTVRVVTNAPWNDCVLTVENDGAHSYGQTRGNRAGYKASYRLRQADLQRLEGLLRSTEWLKQEGKVQADLEDGEKYHLDLVRGGRKASTVCYGPQEKPYEQLVAFLYRLHHQEELQYHLSRGWADAIPYIHGLDAELSGLLGDPNGAPPSSAVLDPSRLVDAVTALAGQGAPEQMKLVKQVLEKIHKLSASTRPAGGRVAGRMRHFVRLVANEKTLTFQGQETTWEQLPTLIAKVPDRARTVFEFGHAPDNSRFPVSNVPAFLESRSRVRERAQRLAEENGFEMFNEVSGDPLGSVGTPSQFVPDLAALSVADAGPWGEEVEQVQCALRADRKVWGADETPWLRACIRHHRTADVVIAPGENVDGLIVDGLWYACWWGKGRPFEHVKRETQSSQFLYLLGQNWRRALVENGKTPSFNKGGFGIGERLQLAPGQHEVRAVIEVSDREDFRRGRTIQVISNPVEIEILPPTAARAAATQPAA